MKAAVIGLGYVGLPLAIRLSQLNFNVLGIDINADKIRKLQKGILPFAQTEPFLEDYFRKECKKGKMSFFQTFEKLTERNLIFAILMPMLPPTAGIPPLPPPNLGGEIEGAAVGRGSLNFKGFFQ